MSSVAFATLRTVTSITSVTSITPTAPIEQMKPTITPNPGICPCGNAIPYAGCCGRFHAGESFRQAPDAEALMRSRYSAYVLGLHDYLLATWHPDSRPARLDPDPPALQWLGLQVRRHVVIDPTHAIVEFVARSRVAGRATRLHETSRFVRQDGHWYYVDALPD